MTIKNLLLLITLFNFGQAIAGSTICQIDSGPTGFKSIYWDSQNTAKVTDFLGTEHAGKVIYSRNFEKGQKINIFIKHQKSFYGADASEFLIFPAQNATFRVIGIGYKFHNGNYYFDRSYKNNPGKCSNS